MRRPAEVHDPAPPLLEVRGVTVRVGGLALIQDVDLEIHPGQVHVLMGPNGGGKSTLLRAVLGQVPFQGDIQLRFRGSGRIGYVPQTFAFDRLAPLTVRDFLTLGLQRTPVWLWVRAATRARLAPVLERTGLVGHADRRLGALSGGEVQRALLARALLQDPELLVLDEPSRGLDPAGDSLLDAVLADLRTTGRGAALLVTHDRRYLGEGADGATLLATRVRARGEPAAVRRALEGTGPPS